MVVSVFGGSMAFAGTAAAASVGSASVSDTVVDQSSTTQTVSFNVDIAAGTSDSVTIDTQEFVSAGVDVTGASASGGTNTDASATVESDNNVTVTVSDTNDDNTAHTGESVSVDLTLDTTSASTGSYTYNIYSGQDSSSDSDTFSVGGPITDAGSPSNIASSDTSQTITGVTANVSGETDGFVYVNITDLAENGVDVDSASVSATATSTSDSAGSTTSVSSNSGVTVAYVSVNDGGGDGDVTLDITLSSLDASNADDVKGVTYDVAGSTGTSTDSRYDSSNGNAPDADNEQTSSFRIGSGAAATGGDVTVNSTTAGNNTLVFQGQVIYTDEFSANDDVELRRVTDSGTSFVTEKSVDSEGDITFDTTDLEADDYILTSDDSGSDVAFEVAVQNLDVTADSTSVDNDGDGALTDVEIDSNRGGTFDHIITSENLDVEELEQITGGTAYDADDDGENDSVLLNAGSGDTFEANFTGIDAGNYTLTFDVEDTTAEDEVDFTVQSIGEGQVSFAQSTYTDQRGDNV
ncbi:beta strand repeat-containing protein, partial [Haloparvum sedimenti]|uniref:beta strand repeat-containing protein n=1 Tax=Haloparvum sedimenti TaxID=1678448 RepID=UPI00373FE40C